MPPTLGARRCGWSGPQLVVDAPLVEDVLVDELSEVEELEAVDEAFDPAGVEELEVSEELELARESLR